MDYKNHIHKSLFLVLVIFIANSISGMSYLDHQSLHVWEMKEIELISVNSYNNLYKEVECWVDLEGPNFTKRIYGFWDGGPKFIVRIVATNPGIWQWRSGSNQPNDPGLNNNAGKFIAIEWTEKEKNQNPNRRGFIRSTENGHALKYADGTPFFMIGDTWLAGATWRLPFRNISSPKNYIPNPGIGFEDAVAYRKGQGYNSVSMISCFPNWESDTNPRTYSDSNGVYLRNAWEKFDYYVNDREVTAKNMRDEYGNKPFKMSKDNYGLSDFDNISPEYFKSLDKKMEYLSHEGFVPLLETVRRDVCPSWKAYFNFNESFARFVQYLISRYGAYNFIFSGIHLDWIPKDYSLTADEFNEALTYHFNKYGPLPFGQPHTTLINNSTYLQFGHTQDCPWLTMHSVGNKPRNHGVYEAIETIFKLESPYPTINFEPYYTGWKTDMNSPNGERPPTNSERDNYFARAQMYGSVLSGGLSGHVHGTSAYDISTIGESSGFRHHIWDALKFESGKYMRHLNTFIMSVGTRYKDLIIGTDLINPRNSPNSNSTGLDGWSFMMLTKEKDIALLYFENMSVLPTINAFIPDSKYNFKWFNPVNGEWGKSIIIKSNSKGILELPLFPNSKRISSADCAAKIFLSE